MSPTAPTGKPVADYPFLRETLTKWQTDADTARDIAYNAYRDAQATVNRLAAVEALINAGAQEWPAGTTVEVTSWDEEPNGDGTYDQMLVEVIFPEDHDSDALVEVDMPAVPAGLCTEERDPTASDWAPFFADTPSEDGYQVVDVDKTIVWFRDFGRARREQEK